MTKKRKPTVADWDKVLVYYLRGETIEYILDNMPDVSLSARAINKRMKEFGYDVRREQINNKVLDNVAKDVTEEKIRTTEACVSAYKKGLDLINGILANYAKEIKERDVVRRRCNPYNMDMLMSGLTKIQKGFDVAYGTDKNGKLYEKQPDVLVIEGLDIGKI